MRRAHFHPSVYQAQSMGVIPFIPIGVAAIKAWAMWQKYNAAKIAANKGKYLPGMYRDPATGRDYYYDGRKSVWTN